MAGNYKENGESQPGVGYYAQKENGSFEIVVAREHESIVLADGTEKTICFPKGPVHWMHDSILRKTNPVPGVKRIIQVYLVPNVIRPVHDPKRIN